MSGGRRRGKGGHGGEFHLDERWMTSYADMITVLMCLFIVLYAMSTVDQKKYDELKNSLASGFGRTRLERVLVIGVRTDILYPMHQQQELVDGFKAVCADSEFVKLDCIRGHDSFLVEMDAFRPVLWRYFAA